MSFTRKSLLQQLHAAQSVGLEDAELSAHIADVDPEVLTESESEDQLIERVEAETPAATIDEVVNQQAEDDVAYAENVVASESLFLELDRRVRQIAALENLADQVNATLDNDGEGLDPHAAMMVSTGAELMEESEQEIAVESFLVDSRTATESLRDTIMEKAMQLREIAAAGIERTVRAARNIIHGALEDVMSSHIRLLSYAKRAQALEGFAGTQIADEKVLNRLRTHMPMDGDGNSQITMMAKMGVNEIIRNVTTLLTHAQRANAQIDPTRPDKALQAIASFFKEVEKLKLGRMKGLDVQVSTPESYDPDALLAMPTIRSTATITQIPGSGSQTYRIVTRDEINSLVDNLSQMRAELKTLENLSLSHDGLTLLDRGRIRFTYRGNDNGEVVKIIKLQSRMQTLMSSIISRLTSDTTYIASRVARHAVMLVAASFEAAGAQVSAGDQQGQ